MCCCCTPDPYQTHFNVTTPAPVIVVRPSIWDRPYFNRMPRPMFPVLPRWNRSPVMPVVVGNSHHGAVRFGGVAPTVTVADRVLPGQRAGFGVSFASHRPAAPSFAGRVVVGR